MIAQQSFRLLTYASHELFQKSCTSHFKIAILCQQSRCFSFINSVNLRWEMLDSFILQIVSMFSQASQGKHVTVTYSFLFIHSKNEYIAYLYLLSRWPSRSMSTWHLLMEKLYCIFFLWVWSVQRETINVEQRVWFGEALRVTKAER